MSNWADWQGNCIKNRKPRRPKKGHSSIRWLQCVELHQDTEIILFRVYLTCFLDGFGQPPSPKVEAFLEIVTNWYGRKIY